jgi:hypothetical protein
MRPLYEAENNRRAQLEVAQRLLALKGPRWRIDMTEPLCAYDALMQQKAGDEVRRYEIKIRYRTFLGGLIERDGYMISKRKLDRIAAPGPRFGIAADCWDGLFVATFARLPPDLRVGQGGRYDRGDPLDAEPCYFIPSRYFRRVSDPVNHDWCWWE